MNEEYMKEALREAQKAFELGEIPVGAVVVHEGKIIGRGHNARQQDQQVTSHAEMIAIRQACERLNSWRLDGCAIFVTLEPCQGGSFRRCFRPLHRAGAEQLSADPSGINGGRSEEYNGEVLHENARQKKQKDRRNIV